MSHEQKQSDFYLLYEMYGELPYDICGASCSTWMFMELLKEPTKTQAKKIYSKLITAYFDRGYESRKSTPLSESIDAMDSEVYKVFVRNGDIKTKQQS